MLPRLRTTGFLLLAFLVLAPPAGAWSWPASGSVLRPFGFGDDPYAGGQHRGIDVAGKEGESVLAPRAGIIAFAGSVPGSGRSVTIRTTDGYSVTLVHLGSLGVRRSASVAEGDPIGTLGRSGDAEWAQPYLHLGVRLTSDPNGYVDPLRFLPPRSVAAPPAPAPAPVPSDPEAPEPAAPPSPPPRSHSGARPHRGGGNAVSLARAGAGSRADGCGTALGGAAGARACNGGI